MRTAERDAWDNFIYIYIYIFFFGGGGGVFRLYNICMPPMVSIMILPLKLFIDK